MRGWHWAAMLMVAGCGPVEAGVLEESDASEDAWADEVGPRETGVDAAGDGGDAGRDVLALDVRDATSDAGRDVPALDVRDAGRDVPALDVRDAASDAGRDVPALDVRDAASDAGRDVLALDVPRVGGCPVEMVRVGAACVDRWEASLELLDIDAGVSTWSPYHNPGTRRVRAVSRPGVQPQGYISGTQAAAACGLAGKRLCALSEWVAACRGPSNTVYPYGNSYVRRRCNEGRTPHPVIQFFGTSMGVFTSTNMNNPGINMQADTVANTGQFAECVTRYGNFDMVGNLHEWIADPNGTFKGGFYVDAEINGRGCLYTTTAHAFEYRDYSTGFRCCAAPTP